MVEFIHQEVLRAMRAKVSQLIMCVAALALGSRPKQGLAKVWAKSEA
jgi:hypothetical protein